MPYMYRKKEVVSEVMHNVGSSRQDGKRQKVSETTQCIGRKRENLRNHSPYVRGKKRGSVTSPYVGRKREGVSATCRIWKGKGRKFRQLCSV